jgi:hypothetical protein
MVKRHRWKANISYKFREPNWVCVQCGLLRDTSCGSGGTLEYYEMGGGRTWYRFAPPCPPKLVDPSAVITPKFSAT